MSTRKLQPEKSAFLVYESWFVSAAPLDDASFRAFFECILDCHRYLTGGAAFDYQERYGKYPHLQYVMPNVLPSLCTSESRYFSSLLGGSSRGKETTKSTEKAAEHEARAEYYDKLATALKEHMFTFDELRSLKRDSPLFREMRGVPSPEEIIGGNVHHQRSEDVRPSMGGKRTPAAGASDVEASGQQCPECGGAMSKEESPYFIKYHCPKCGKEQTFEKGSGTEVNF